MLERELYFLVHNPHSQTLEKSQLPHSCTHSGSSGDKGVQLGCLSAETDISRSVRGPGSIGEEFVGLPRFLRVRDRFGFVNIGK